jgi:hypothetical protein
MTLTIIPMYIPEHCGCDYQQICRILENGSQLCQCVDDPNNGWYILIIIGGIVAIFVIAAFVAWAIYRWF